MPAPARASATALAMVGGAAMVPPSAMPFMPPGVWGQGVLHERPAERLAGLVVRQVLEQRAAEPLRHSAGQLAVDEHRVEQGAAVVGHPVTQHGDRSEEHTSELQSQFHLVCRLLLEKKKQLM